MEATNKRPYNFFRRVKIGQPIQEEIFKLPSGRAFLLRRVTIKAPNQQSEQPLIVPPPESLAPASYVEETGGAVHGFEWRTEGEIFSEFTFHAEKVVGIPSLVTIDADLLAADVFAFDYGGSKVYKKVFFPLNPYGLPAEWFAGEAIDFVIHIKWQVKGKTPLSEFAEVVGNGYWTI